MIYSTEYNAIRGFRRVFPMLATFSDDLIRADFIDREDGGYVLNLGAIADAQDEKLGEASTTPRVIGVPMLRRSIKPRGATARARAFFAALPAGTARKDALAAAVANGIAFYTARTQWQNVRAA